MLTVVGIDGGGNLVINDVSGTEANDLTIAVDGSNLRVSQSSNPLVAAAGATPDGIDILVPIASITGTINVLGQGGDDTLEVDLSDGLGGLAINFDGGTQTTEDALSFTATSVSSVTHSFTNANDGAVVVVDGAETVTINYTGLEPIADNLSAADRIFVFTSANAETVTLSDDGTVGNNISMIDSTESESVTFVNPTSSLTVEVTVSGGSGEDDISIQGLDSLFDADLTIGGGGNDDVVFETADTDIGTGTAIIRGREITIDAGVTTNGANITFQSTEEIVSTAAVSSGGGNITFHADTDQVTTPGGSVVMNSASVTSSGGDIVIGGGANPLTTSTIATAAAPELDGVYIHDTPINAGSGDISIRGSSALSEDGVDIGSASQITTMTGTITIVGDATGTDDGIDMHSGSSIMSTSGDISLTGTATGASAEDGILIRDGFVATSTGAITLTGTGAGDDSGIQLIEASIESTGTGAGAIKITGTSDDAFFLEGGVIVDETLIRSATGPVVVDGSSGQHIGTGVVFDSIIESTGTGTDAATITISGNGGLVGVVGLAATVTSVNGDISIDGTGGENGGIDFQSFVVSSTGTDSNAAAIAITGTADESDGVLLTDFEVDPTVISTVAGPIQITGDASSGAGAADSGVFIDTQAIVTSTGTSPFAGPITIMGTGDTEDGVFVGGTVSSVDGTIQIDGTATGGEEGIQVEGGDVVATGSGTIAITGQGNAATDNTGVRIDSFVTSSSGIITMGTPQGRILIDGNAAVTSTSGGIALTTTDSATTGDNIEIGLAAMVTSDSGTLLFLAGDDLVTDATSTVSTSSTIEIVIDSGNADPGVGGTANLVGLVTAASLTGTGNSDDDVINLAAGISPFARPSTLMGNAGNDTLIGGSDADLIVGGAGDDVLSGHDGDDVFLWNDDDGSDLVDGDAGNDRQIVNTADEVSEGDNVTVADSLQRQVISRSTGTLIGAFAIDIFTVETFEVNLLAGPDSLDASGLASISGVFLAVDGGTENDSVTGSESGDSILGRAGDDLIEGGGGNDTLGGGDDDDVFVWNNGDGSDTVDGGNGTDRQAVNATDLAVEGDQFTVADNGARDLVFRSAGTSIGAFSIDAGTVEEFEFDLLAGADRLNGSGLTGAAFIVSGGSENDTISGGSSGDTISADEGEDRVFAGGGDDLIDGGEGADRLFGDGGNDRLSGDPGSDFIRGGDGADSMEGEAGRDTLYGGRGNDELDGGDDEDTIFGGNGRDAINGSGGNDRLFGGNGYDSISGGVGDDFLRGGRGEDVLTGNAGADEILGDLHNDRVFAGDGNDSVDGGGGDDRLFGDDGADTIFGHTGDDFIRGGLGADSLFGGLGGDTISGDAGDDRLLGSTIDDFQNMVITDLGTLNDSDEDSLLGGDGDDILVGAIGSDVVNGGAGADILDVGSGGNVVDGIDSIVAAEAADQIFKDPEDVLL